MSSIEFLDLMTRIAKSYRHQAIASIPRNDHMHRCHDWTPTQDQIDAVLTDFINYAGTRNGVDYALNSTDLV